MDAPLWVLFIFAGAIIALLITLVWKIRRGEQLKKEFIAVVSHRLRTPLTQMQWMVSGVSSEVSSREGKDLVGNMETILKDLTMVLNQFLDASEAGKTSLFYDYLFTETSMTILVHQVIADYAMGVKEKDILLTTDIAENIPKLLIDSDRMKIAIGALLENAIVYSKKGEKIEIKVWRDKESVSFSIRDEGIGISANAMRNLFSKFYRTKEAVTHDRDRAGLGLFIAQQIVKKHGGKIVARSGGLNRGSQFVLSIPLS